MKTIRHAVVLLTALAPLAGCAPVAPLATGDAARTWMREQTQDPQASARYGERAPQGSDPELVNAAVEQLRKPARARQTPMGGRSGLLGDLFKELGE